IAGAADPGVYLFDVHYLVLVRLDENRRRRTVDGCDRVGDQGGDRADQRRQENDRELVLRDASAPETQLLGQRVFLALHVRFGQRQSLDLQRCTNLEEALFDGQDVARQYRRIDVHLFAFLVRLAVTHDIHLFLGGAVLEAA